MNKDQSIITQVAAKIAADLVKVTEDVNMNVADWSIAFDAVLDAIMTAHGAAAPTQTSTVQVTEPYQVLQNAFPNSTVETASISVKGTQHGPLPDWLAAQAAAVGCTQVWDNRDGLAQNPKRPWFKAADGTKNAKGDDVAFWPPKGQ